jgi:hypothetical protein
VLSIRIKAYSEAVGTESVEVLYTLLPDTVAIVVFAAR